MQGNPVLLRIALLLVAAAVVPACGSSGGGLLPGGGGTSLYSSDGTFPDAAKWSAVTGAGSVTQDGVNGSPAAPSITMTGGNGQNASITTLAAFTTPSLTISVRIACLSGVEGTGIVTITEAGGPTVAFMQWDSATGATLFNIDGTAAAGPGLLTDGAFHTLVFTVNGAGNATLDLDGGAVEVGPVAWPNGITSNTLTLGVSIPGGGGANAVFNFDTVSVTTP